MGTAAQLRRLEPDAFLSWEAGQLDRFELVDGVPYAMAGAGRLHEEVAGAIFALLWNHLDGKPCRAFKGDRKLQIGKDFFYPDVIVTCDANDRNSDGALTAPVAVVEVLSRPTAAYDRGEKRERYITIPSLEVYLIVDPEARAVERYDRSGDWQRRILRPDEAVVVDAIGCRLDSARFFAAING